MSPREGFGMSSGEPTVPDSMEDSFVCIDGDLKPADEPHIRAYDHGFMYADGVYDAFPVYESKAILLDRHLDRLYRSADAAKMDIRHSKADIREWIVETLEASGVDSGGCRVIVSRGAGKQGIKNTDQVTETTVAIIPTHTPRDEVAHGRPTEERARIVSTRTIPPDSIDPKLKGLNYLNNIMAERELAGTDATIGIMLDHQGRVAEAFDANVFLRDEQGTFITPGTVNSLAGITRSLMLDIAEDLGHEVTVTDVTPAELFAAEDVFLTGSGCGVSSVVELDGRPIGDQEPSPAVIELAEAFREYVTSNEYVELQT